MRAAWLVVLVGWPSLAFGATPLTNISADLGSGIVIRVQSIFDVLPASGHVPIIVDIDNGTTNDGVWLFSSEANRNYNDMTLRFEERLEVPQGARRRFELYVPLPGIGAEDRGQLNAELSLRGPAIVGSAYLSGFMPGEGAMSLPTVGVSTQLDALIKALQPQPTTDTSTLALPEAPRVRVLQFDVATLPKDWRGLLGLDGLWLTGPEALRIGAEEEIAIKSWVAQGGELVLVRQFAESGLPLFEADTWANGNYGFGRLTLASAENLEEQVATAVRHRARVALEVMPGGDHNPLEALPVARAPILVFLLVFALAIGPINFWVLARPPHRQRLLYTTPLISGSAAVLVLGLVLIGDGVGGEGRRTVISLLLPEEHLAISLQGQIARTGLMLDSSMDAPLHRWVAEVGHPPGPFQRQTRVGERLGGPWFPSRSNRAQLLEQIEPTRARIELIPGTPPRLRSTYGERLARVFYLDREGRSWNAVDLDAGEEQALEPADAESFFTAELDGGFELQRVLVLPPRPGWFYAVPADPKSSMLESGTRIHWTDTAVVMGPLVEEAAND